MSQASLSQLEDIDEDLETPMTWTRAVTTPATTGTPCRMPGQMMGCSSVTMMGQVPMQRMMMVVPVPQGAVPQALPVMNGAMPMMMVSVTQGPVQQVPQGAQVPHGPQQGVPGGQEGAPLAPQHNLCVAVQQDPYMVAEGNGGGGAYMMAAEGSGCGMMQQLPNGLTTPATQDGQASRMSRQVSGSSFGTPCHQQDSFSMSSPPSRQISVNCGAMNQDPSFLMSTVAPARQISGDFCTMNPDDAVKLLERAMPEHYEE